ncbi:MAG: M50 family metallopeptidase [Candidatus Micrarchaeia archaeon]
MKLSKLLEKAEIAFLVAGLSWLVLSVISIYLLKYGPALLSPALVLALIVISSNILKQHLKLQTVLTFVIVFSIVGFYIIVKSDLEALPKLVSCVFLLYATTKAVSSFCKIENQYGLLILRGKAGIALLDEVASAHKNLWKTFADIGLVLGFGLPSIFMNRKMGWRVYLASLILLVFFILFVMPTILPITFSVINLPITFRSATAQYGSSSDYVWYGMLAILLIGGLSTATVAGLIMQGLYILLTLIAALFFGIKEPMSKATPGASLLLPGINIDFISGIAAIAVLLFVHEFSHGVLSRVMRIPVTSTGLVFFGILPFGAFVDPDEKELQKKDKVKQTRVLVAGSAANLLVSLISMFLLFSLLLITEPYEDRRVFLAEVDNKTIERTAIISINGYPIHESEDYKNAVGFNPGTLVNITTEKGSIVRVADENGKIGILVSNKIGSNIVFRVFGRMHVIPPAYKDGFEWISFFYSFLALSFVLNFLIGSVNLLPIPAFDGFRILELNIDRRIMNIIVLAVVLSFLANFLPWLWI